VALTAFLPFARGALAGHCLYFRDLSLHFFPLRRFALEGLRSGEIRFWNPYVHQGIPLAVPAIGYPLDLLQALRPDPTGISLLLALHVPLAALAMLALGRRLGLTRLASAGGALVYALGGFLLSSVNLYVYVQAAAWAPLIVLAFLRLAESEAWRRPLAFASVVLAVGMSTAGIEIVGQALLAGMVLGLRGAPRRAGRGLLRQGVAIALAVAAAAPVLVLVAGEMQGSARARGFSSDVILAHSVHPFALVQVVVAGLFGNPSNLAAEWWGVNFFPRGFPYVLSLYLGAAALTLAAAGLASSHALAKRLALLGGAGLLVCLGRWAGWGAVVDALPLAAFRFPVKAFFTVQLAASLLAAIGIDALERAGRREWRAVLSVGGALGGLLVASALLPRAWPGPVAAFARAFLPSDLAAAAHPAVMARVLGDAATGGAVALAAAAVAALALRRGTLAPPRAALLVTALVVADLLRAGAGLNPMVSADFYRASRELAGRLGSLRAGRVFTCSVESSPAYLGLRLARPGGHEALTFAALSETLSPSFNVPIGVPTALSPDLTMLVPERRVLSPAEGSCRDLDAILPRLRAAGVASVLSLDALQHPALVAEGEYSPARIAPLTVRVYRLDGSLPAVELREGRGRLGALTAGVGTASLGVDADTPSLIVWREGWARGWHATRDGAAVPVLEADGMHVAVRVPAGRCTLTLRYTPPGIGLALAGSLLALGALVLIVRRA